MISNRQIIEALRCTATKKEAAEMLNISRQTLYERIKRPEFIEELERVAEAEEIAFDQLRNTAVGNALEFLNSVIEDDSILGYTNSERIRAAQIVLAYNAR